MYKIAGQIEGVAPILFSAWTSVKGLQPGGGGGGGRMTQQEIDDETANKVYRSRDQGGNLGDTLVLPAWNFKKCLLEGCGRAGIKVGRSSAVPFFTATIFVDGELSFGVDKPADQVHHATGKRPPKTGGACLIERPQLLPGWQLGFRLVVVDDRRSSDDVKRALEEAGMLVGLGSWRPEYGRFIVREFRREQGT